MGGAISGVDGNEGDPSGATGMPHNFLLDHVSPATRLLEKRRQMFEIQEALEAQKEEFSRCLRARDGDGVNVGVLSP